MGVIEFFLIVLGIWWIMVKTDQDTIKKMVLLGQ